MKLCLQDLLEMTGGELKLAAMPPLEGELTPIQRIVLQPRSIEAGDVFWCLAAERCDIELAFLRGAVGVVCANWTVEPWPGRFVLIVDDTVAALEQTVAGLSIQIGLRTDEEILGKSSELKVLQLCGARPFSISPPTCGRSARDRWSKSCRRHAA